MKISPDASLHDPRPEYLRALIDQAGMSQRDAAVRIGVGERLFRYYLTGWRMQAGEKIPCLAPYPVQFALECLAAKQPAGHAAGRKGRLRGL